MTQSQPPITRTSHTLSFDKLSPCDFERLCLWLVEREGYERAEHLGAAGSEQGRDLTAWRDDHLWAFQCKRVQTFGLKNALAELDKILALPPDQRPAELVFIVTCDISVNTHQQARARCAGQIECHFWTGTELDAKVKRYPDIVQEFFQAGRDRFVITDPQGNVHIGDVVYAKTEVEELRESLRDAVNTLRTNLTRRIRRAARTRPEEPYLYLDYFDLEHTTVFHGRDIARQVLLAHIHAERHESRLTLLHAPSGAGKTSLLRAGIVPGLYDAGDLPIYIHHPRGPVASIKHAILPAAPHPDKLAVLPLRTFLAWTAEYLEHSETLVILLDQFEEFFIQFTPAQQRPFIVSLADCYQAEGLPVKFVLAMRKDYFSDMAMFAGELDKVFHNQFLLPALTRDEATRAITLPLDGTGMDWETGAVELLLDYLDQGEIAPPHMQLICSRLYDATKEAGQKRISVEGVNLHSIHADYLVEEMSAPGFLPAQCELGWRLLKQLVTSEGTKQVLSLDELYEVAPPDEVDPVLKRLVDRRLLRRDESEGETLIEVAHDTLAAEIAAHETGPERREKVARELVERGLVTWRQFAHLMEAPMLGVLDQYRDALVSPSPKALEFIFRSALVAGHETAYWFERAREGGVDVDEIALEGLQSNGFRTRTAAVAALDRLGERFAEPIIGMLADDYPQVRVAAIHALERLRPDGAWRGQLVYERYVPAEIFIMGDDGKDVYDKKVPAHRVNLDTFYIAKYPVTNADYKRYADDIEQPFEIPEGKADNPVVEVACYDARNYAAWAGMRLPTEAEWEKAASWDEGVGGHGDKETKGQGDEETGGNCSAW